MFGDKLGSAVIICVCFCVVNCYYVDDNLPTYLTGAVGDYMIFNCEIDFPQRIPIPYKLIWRRGEEVIYSWQEGIVTESDDYVGRIHLLNRGFQQYQQYGKASINLTSIRESDAGWFECKIEYPNRNPSSRNNGTWFHLTVSGGNLLAIPPINRTVMEGDEVQFDCLPKDFSIKIRWLKDKIPLSEYHDLVQRSWVTKENTLVIHPTDLGDYGEYECEASNDMGERQTTRAFLNVQYKAKVIYAPPEIYLPFGRPALIDCHFRANPPLTNLRWEKDGFLFDPYNIQGVFYRKNGSLYFSKVDESHTGKYSCTPYNELGTQGPSPTMNIIVQRPPVFVSTPHNLYLRKLGENIEIPCDATDGQHGHKPIIVWYRKDGSSLPVGRYSIKDGNLTITNIEEHDRGLYQCSATNKAATITAETELLVENIPSSAPYNLTAVSSPYSVHISWLAGRQRANIDFSVWYKSVDQTEWKTYPVPSIRTLEATIINLHPDTEYEFMVLCKDDNGDGLFSKSLRVWTKSEDGDKEPFKTSYMPPIGFPRNVTVVTKDDGLLVNWEKPEYGFENLKRYIIRWSQGPDEYIYGSDDTTETHYLITNLLEGNEYDIQVIALSLDDQQGVSEKVRAVFPGYKSIKAVSTGIIAGLAFLTAAFLTVLYIKRRKSRNDAASNYTKSVKS
ncbi:unnamed protein product [Brassicogethes aeneus]|uniref:Protein turtle n=1 Tax=Brassicogethes aeneus TaxID=1431903 RepID=A0A9P0BCT5_BRAAE|nr:unnamed protein product [Brassicogethes aeneus]